MQTYTCIHLKIKPYVKQYFEFVFGKPCDFPNKYLFNLLLHRLLSKVPADYIPKPIDMDDPELISIILPYYSDKDIRYYNYLSETAQEILRSKMRDELYLQLKLYVRKFMCDEFRKQENNRPYVNIAIRMFIDEHGMDPTCFDTLIRQCNRSEIKKNAKKSLI